MAELPPFELSASGFKFTQSPNPGWTYGQKIDATAAGREWLAGEEAGWKVIDGSTEDPVQLYKLMISGIIPRPIAFVSTVSEDGVENLAPFSWFNQVAASPPTISISASNGPPRIKDTTTNIKTTKGFTVNIISEPWIESANVASVDAPAGVGEWPMSGLTKEKSILVKAPRVKESAFSMECEFLQAIDIIHPTTGRANSTLILGTVKYIHVRKDVLNEKGLVDPAKLKPVARLGDITYASLGDGFRLTRPSWETDGETIKEAVKSVSE